MGILKIGKIRARIPRAIALGLVFLILFSLLSARSTAGILPRIANPLSSLGQNVGRMALAGDIKYTPVYLDGRALFRIGSQESASVESDGNGLSPVDRRARRIERGLINIVNNGFDPERLNVTTATLNSQTVIVASDGGILPRQVLLTVTEIDSLLDASSPEELARQWGEIIREALIRAWQARQPEARRQQLLSVAIVALTMVVLSWGLIWWHQSLKKRFRELRKQAIAHSSVPLQAEGTPQVESIEFRQKANLQQKLTVNILIRRLLLIGLILLWFGGVATMLYTFPETRLEGRDVLRIPLRVFLIWLVLLLIANSINLYVNYRLREWVEEGAVVSENSQRRVLRAPTLLEVSRGIVGFASLCVGIIWFVVWTGFPLSTLLTGAGLLGAILTFVFQNLLKDWVNGFLIIFEDQYAVGDMIQFDGFLGIVENMSLRATQLRGIDGRSITIPHNQIITAHNLSRDWSRVFFTIEVAYQTDPDVAIELMRETALEMAKDPQWKKDIIDPVQIIGVSKVSNSGIEILLLIVTQRLRHLDVDREYRRRLKLAFDARRIVIGMPQQSLYFARDNQNN